MDAATRTLFTPTLGTNRVPGIRVRVTALHSPAAPEGGKVFDWCWFLFWGLLSTGWCVSAAWELGATFDEPVYVQKGLERWRTGSYSSLLRLGTMPMPVDVVTLPLYLYERATGRGLDDLHDLDRLLPWARCGTLLFWWLLLVYGRLLGRALAGPWGGRLAVALLACEPSMLANASLATTDLATSACLMMLVYYFRAGRDGGWGRRLFLPALCLGAVVLAKASGLIFGIVCMAMIELEYRVRSGTFLLNSNRQAGWRLSRYLGSLFALRKDMGKIIGLGLLVVFVYCGSDWQPQSSFVAWADGLVDGPGKTVMSTLAHNLRIFSNAGEGLIRQVKHNLQGHYVYLAGRQSSRALWYYFPLAITIKLTLTVLFLPIVALILRPRSLLNTAFLCGFTLLALSIVFRVQIGIRLILPLVALLMVGGAAAFVDVWRHWRSTAGRCLLGGIIGAGLLSNAASVARLWPHALCYTNELWGNTRDGYLHVSDANYDWGQGVKDLSRWQSEHRDHPLAVWYFGTDPLLDQLPIRRVAFSLPPIPTPEHVQSAMRGHYLAVSTTLLYGGYTGAAEELAVYLRTRIPVDRTQTFLIYYFPDAR